MIFKSDNKRTMTTEIVIFGGDGNISPMEMPCKGSIILASQVFTMKVITIVSNNNSK